MPQKRQAARPDGVREPPKPKATDTYPSAPSDPQSRLEWLRRRNAAIAGVNEADYLEALREQDGRSVQHLDQQRPKRHT